MRSGLPHRYGTPTPTEEVQDMDEVHGKQVSRILRQEGKDGT